MSAEHDLFIQKLEDAGLVVVRANLARGVYGAAGKRRHIAEDWADRKEQNIADGAQAEQTAIASRTSDATVRQATAAERALWISVFSVILSIVAIAVSIAAIRNH